MIHVNTGQVGFNGQDLSVPVITAQNNDAVVIRCGFAGEDGSDGLMSEAAVISVINSHVTSIPHLDAIHINDGRVRVVVEVLDLVPAIL